MKKAVVLLSSGLDSTVNLYRAKQDCDVVLALTFDYGQRAAAKEIQQAQKIAKKLNVPHRVMALPWIKELGQSALTHENREVPTQKQVSMDDMTTSLKTAKAVWVPNRNGIFLNVAAGFAESLQADYVIPGFNIEEGATFPDNTEAYLQSLTHAFSFSTANKVQVLCYTTALNKTQIVQLGRKLGVDFDDIWPCYFSLEKPCGQCESCQRFGRALKANA